MSHPVDPAQAHKNRLLREFGLESTWRNPTSSRGAAVEWARSGAMSLTGAACGPPQFAGGALASAARGAALALGALAPGSLLDGLDGPALLAERAALVGLTRNGSHSPGGSAKLLPSASGMIALNLPRPDDWRLMPALLETDARDDSSDLDWDFVAERVARFDRDALVTRGRLMGLAIAPAARVQPDTPALFKRTRENDGSPLDWKTRTVRLLDLSSLWAGPLASSLLAMAGIEILKVEGRERPDGARHGPQSFFDLLNGNKQGAGLDLHHSKDRSLFEELLESADIVLESARPRGLRQLGFDAESWVEARRGRIWASITGYGRENDGIAFGDDAAIAAGLAWPVDDPEGPPRFCADAIADPLTGLHSAFLILAHLATGRGGLLDLSLVDITAHASAIDHDDLALPILGQPDTDDGHIMKWFAVQVGVDGESHIPIEKPRARTHGWTAPPLEPISRERLSKWITPC